MKFLVAWRSAHTCIEQSNVWGFLLGRPLIFRPFLNAQLILAVKFQKKYSKTSEICLFIFKTHMEVTNCIRCLDILDMFQLHFTRVCVCKDLVLRSLLPLIILPSKVLALEPSWRVILLHDNSSVQGVYFQHFHFGINLMPVLVKWNTPSPCFPPAERLSG